MLVVVHNRDVELRFQALFNFKTFGSLYIFQVNAAKSWRDGFNSGYYLINVFFVYFDVENINIGKNFKQ